MANFKSYTDATYEPLPAGIEEGEFFRTVEHALKYISEPNPPEHSFHRYQFDLNRPLKGRNSLKLPVFQKERPEAIAAVANLAGLSKVEGKEEYLVEYDHSNAVNIGKKMFRMLQNHLIQKYRSFEPLPAGIEEDEFFRTVKHALKYISVPNPPEHSFHRYLFDLNRPLKGRNCLKLPVFKTERPEAIAAVANLVGLSKVEEQGKEEYCVEYGHLEAVNIGKKLFRMLQNHLIQKYDKINGDSEMKPNDKVNKLHIRDAQEKWIGFQVT
ncbi:hypothetical protein Ddc_14756 [Ditylenchus destructor]|nr:hypothetical protein Ddc_14756 [Ditylenchus destructor]